MRSRSRKRKNNKRNDGPAPMRGLIFQNAELNPKKLEAEKMRAPEIDLSHVAEVAKRLSARKKPPEKKPEGVEALYAYQKSAVHNPKAKMWMWVGVIVLSGMIFGLWGWSLLSRLSLFNWSNSPEKMLFNRAGQDWDKLYNAATDNELEREFRKNEVKNLLKQIMAQAEANAPTTTASATSSTVASSTISPTKK